MLFEFALGEDLPVFEDDPVGACEVGRGTNAFDFEQVGELIGVGGEAADMRAAGFGLEHGEHFAADRLVEDPVDEVIPLQSFFHARKG